MGAGQESGVDDGGVTPLLLMEYSISVAETGVGATEPLAAGEIELRKVLMSVRSGAKPENVGAATPETVGGEYCTVVVTEENGVASVARYTSVQYSFKRNASSSPVPVRERPTRSQDIRISGPRATQSVMDLRLPKSVTGAGRFRVDVCVLIASASLVACRGCGLRHKRNRVADSTN